MGAQIYFFCKFTRKANKILKVFSVGGATAERSGGKVVSKLEV